MTVLIIGNTFPVKEALKALGGRWDPTAKGWRVPVARASEAKALVSGANSSTSSSPSKGRYYKRGTWTGCSCGSVEEYARANDCSSCQHDR